MLAFVLGAGSSRGALQAGALQALFEAGIEPEILVGSSIGALNAAFLAQEPSLKTVEKLQQIYTETSFQDVFTGGNLDTIRNIMQGEENLFDNSGLEKLIADHIHCARFGECQLPCYVIATNIDNGDLVVFGDKEDDELLPALLSSTAMLPVFPPHKVNGQPLGDGGLKAMLPIQVAVDRGASAILALNITTQLKPYDERNNMLSMLLHVVDLLTLAQVQATIAATDGNAAVPVHVLNLQPEEYTSMMDLDNLQSLIDQGYQQAQQAIENNAFQELMEAL